MIRWAATAIVGGTLVAACSSSESPRSGDAVVTTPPSVAPTTAVEQPTVSEPVFVPISTGVPVFASSPDHASAMNTPYTDRETNTAYDTLGGATWSAAGTGGWLAYDLSEVAVAQRSTVRLAWYNPSTTFECCAAGDTVGIPIDYRIEAHDGAGGGAPPTDGWRTVERVEGNTMRVREHVVDLGGASWIRLSFDRAQGDEVALIHVDVYDASHAAQVDDGWAFYGDSITYGAVDYAEVYFGSPDNLTFASAVGELVPGRFPVQVNGGIVGVSSDFAVEHIDRWLDAFTGRYVVLAYGTNDSAAAVSADDFLARYRTLVDAVESRGKVAIVPLVPWSESADYNDGFDPDDVTAGRTGELNAAIRRLYSEHPDVMPGPDFEGFFFDHPEYLDGDVHPFGHYGTMREIWACFAAIAVYDAGADSLRSTFCAPYLDRLP